VSTTDDLRRPPRADGCQALTTPRSAQVGQRPEVSITICTHNRSGQLANLVRTLALQGEGAPVEILVVDSASAPDHAGVVQAAVSGHGKARLVRLEKKGVSLARNTGLEHARAAWVAFIDDDETPSPDWVEQVCALARRLPEDCAACSGVVRPVLHERALPAVGNRWRAYLGAFERSGEFDQTADVQFGVGHSLVRMAALKQVGGFHLRLGRHGDTLLSGEEVLLLHQLVAAGWRIWHSDRISVEHDVEPERLERSWARRRAYWEGVSTARILQIVEPREIDRRSATAALKSLPLALSAAMLPIQREVDLRLAFNAGLVFECFRLGKSRKGNVVGRRVKSWTVAG
jgi:glycosyltransferase involved in cell wall biosynthesis